MSTSDQPILLDAASILTLLNDPASLSNALNTLNTLNPRDQENPLDQLIQVDDLLILPSIDSTNSYLLQQLDEINNNGNINSNKIQLCLAETQTHGKGQFERTWHSPFGQNIYCSMAIPWSNSLNRLSGLSLVVALAVIQALESSIKLPQDLLVKWPNDIMVQQQKLAGILIELKHCANSQYYIIIGIGLNVNMTMADQQVINQAWTSLRLLTGVQYDRNLLCAQLIKTILRYITHFKQHGLAKFLPEWHHSDYLAGKTIVLQQAHQQYNGVADGIDQRGNLLVKLADSGEIKSFTSGEVRFHTG